MPATMTLNPVTWDLVLDQFGNMALTQEPGSLAQDAASAILTFLGEVYYDTTVGVPWLTQILGKQPTLALLKAQLVAAALSVPDVASAQVFISSFTGRSLSGQVQVTSSSGATAAANFAVANPIG